MTKTSEQWWSETKNDDQLLNDWLIKQYRGEVTAAHRIRAFAEQYCNDKRAIKILHVIAEQEEQHASWVLDLLKARDIEPDVSNAEERYWKETLPDIESFETGAAVGAHAEAMRLERIRAIAEDSDADTDIRETFQRILKDEVFHERTFRSMAGESAMLATAQSHERGLEVLGLHP